MQRPLGEARREERDGLELLVYECGCYAYMETNEMKVLPCAPDHAELVKEAVLELLAEAGLQPLKITRTSLVKH